MSFLGQGVRGGEGVLWFSGVMKLLGWFCFRGEGVLRGNCTRGLRGSACFWRSCDTLSVALPSTGDIIGASMRADGWFVGRKKVEGSRNTIRCGRCILTLRLTAGAIRRHGRNSCKSFGLVYKSKTQILLTRSTIARTRGTCCVPVTWRNLLTSGTLHDRGRCEPGRECGFSVRCGGCTMGARIWCCTRPP